MGTLLQLHEPAPPPPSAPTPTSRHHRLRPWLVGALAALLVVGVGTAGQYWLHARPVPPPLVFLAPVTRGPVTGHLSVAGSLAPVESRTITQPIAGRATEVAVRVGDEVGIGQVVARFDPMVQRAEVARAESRVVAAEAEAFRAEMLLLRLQQTPPRDDDEETEDAVAVAQVRLATAAAEMEARTVALRLAQRQLGDRVIRSPIAGVVLERAIEPGQSVGAGAPIVVIGTTARRLNLLAEVSESALAQVAAGQSARFTVPAFPGRSFEARVTGHGPLRGPEGARHFPVTLEVANESGDLTVGMTAAVDISTGRSGAVYRVPLAALSFSPTGPGSGRDQPAIWLGDASGSALVRTPVEVGATDGVHAEVRAARLQEGAMVAVSFGRPSKP
jgi:HlyD family secretion protein